MKIRLTTTLITMILILSFAICSQAASVSEVQFEKHNLNLTLDVPTQSAQIVDYGTVTISEGWNLFYINHSSQIDSFVIGNSIPEYISVTLTDSTELPSDILDGFSTIEPDSVAQLIFFKSESESSANFYISFHATFNDEVENTRFSRENVGREVSGTIIDKGAYFSPSSYFYPQGAEGASNIILTINIPSEWESISDGNFLSKELIDNRKIQSWENPFESDGVMLMAAPYVTSSRIIDNIEVACYFFEEDTSLFEGYLDATVGYIKMYSDLIGPYPYQRFTVAENFFPTGYGMPAWTLLGQQVIRLPFIKHTSLGHEVLHNWWGNSVYVDYDRGNWCEGSTVYGADYRYKLLQSDNAAKAYRKNILKQYVSYIDDQNDFPIREFTSRTSTGTRTIGYNKAMMVFHMIEEIIGTESFFDAWKQIYSDYIGKKISWEEWIATYEKSSGADLSFIIPQWIDRTGAPVLDVKINNNDLSNKQSKAVSFTLSDNSGQNYHLKIPIRFESTEAAIDTFVIFNSPESTYTMTIPNGMTSLMVDPEYNIFRKMYPEEIEPIVSLIMGNPDKQFITYESDSIINNLFNEFGMNLTGDSITISNSVTQSKETKEDFLVILNPTELPSFLENRIKHVNDSLTLNNETYPSDSHTFILTGKDWEGFKNYMVIISKNPESLPRLGQLVPHYGKYSYLVFEGARNIAKGQWDIDDTPLRKEL